MLTKNAHFGGLCIVRGAGFFGCRIRSAGIRSVAFFVGGVIRNFFLWRWDKLGAVVFVCFLSSGTRLRWGWYFLGAR